MAYEDIEDFRYSLPDIKSVEELKEAILKRYKKSMSHIPDDEKLRLGVGVTELEVIEKKGKP